MNRILSAIAVCAVLLASRVTTADERAGVLIPFANEVTQDEIDSAYGNWAVGFDEDQLGDTIHLRMRRGSLAQHLVSTHKCPAWVAEYYSGSPELLARIHKGYELKYDQDKWSEELRKEYKLNDPESRKYWTEKREYYGRFKMLFVKRQ